MNFIGELGSTRKQLPGVLHPWRDQVPRRDPRIQTEPEVSYPGILACVWFSLAPSREHAHILLPLWWCRCADRLPSHERIRGEHLHIYQQGGEVPLCQVPLEADMRSEMFAWKWGGGYRRQKPQSCNTRSVWVDCCRELPWVEALCSGYKFWQLIITSLLHTIYVA